MDEQKLVEQIVSEFDCSQRTAERIADMAKQHHQDRNVGKTADDWISHMKESGRTDPITAWNWAVSTYDATDWNLGSEESGENPYKITQ